MSGPSGPQPPMNVDRARTLQNCQALKDSVKRDQCIDEYLKQQREEEQKKVGEQGGMWAGIAFAIGIFLFFVVFGAITLYKKQQALKLEKAAKASKQ